LGINTNAAENAGDVKSATPLGITVTTTLGIPSVAWGIAIIIVTLKISTSSAWRTRSCKTSAAGQRRCCTEQSQYNK
jgi:hypothetical protein